jgi:invasion protein IalB
LPTAALVLAAFALWALPAAAKPEKGKVFGDWTIDCEGPPDKQTCFASQTQVVKEGNQLVKFTAGHLGPNGQPAAVVILPLGFYIPAGAAFRVDDKEQVPLGLQRCLPQGCVSSAPLDDRRLHDLRAGKQVIVGLVVNPGGGTIGIPVSLKGFKTAFDSLDK